MAHGTKIFNISFSKAGNVFRPYVVGEMRPRVCPKMVIVVWNAAGADREGFFQITWGGFIHRIGQAFLCDCAVTANHVRSWTIHFSFLGHGQVEKLATQ